MKKGKFSYGAKVLLALLVLRCIVDIFEDSYITTQLSTVTNGNTLKIAIYYIVKHLICPFGALLTGKLVKKHYLAVMRLGIIVDLIFFIAFSQISNNWISIILIAAIQGLALVWYYLPLSFVTANWVLENERHKLLSYQNAISKTMSIIIPVTLGTVIYVGSYSTTINLMIIVVVLQLVLLAIIHNNESTNETSSFEIIKFVKNSIKDKEMRASFLIIILRGLTLIGAQSQIINMLIFDKFGNEYELGKITSVIAILSIIMFWIFGKFGSEKLYRKIIVVFTAIQITTVTLLLLSVNKITIILIKACFDCILSIIGLIVTNYLYKLTNKPLNSSMKSEFFVFQEFGVNIGRIISWGIVIVCSFSTTFSYGTILTFSIAIITVAFLGMSVLLYKYN